MLYKKIHDQVEWYYTNSAGANIEKLLELQDRLTGNLFFVSEEYGKAYQEYVGKYGLYRESRGSHWLNLRHKQEKLTQGEINMQVEQDTLVEHSEQMFADCQIESLKKLLDQGNRVVSAIQQRISYMKIELNQTTGNT